MGKWQHAHRRFCEEKGQSTHPHAPTDTSWNVIKCHKIVCTNHRFFLKGIEKRNHRRFFFFSTQLSTSLWVSLRPLWLNSRKVPFFARICQCVPRAAEIYGHWNCSVHAKVAGSTSGISGRHFKSVVAYIAPVTLSVNLSTRPSVAQRDLQLRFFNFTRRSNVGREVGEWAPGTFRFQH